jgi:hypothetical protein
VLNSRPGLARKARRNRLLLSQGRSRTYNVDATAIGRLLGDRPFHGGANLVALQ